MAMMRRSRETRRMKPKPLHQTPSRANAACLYKVLPIGKPFYLPTLALFWITGTVAEASSPPDVPCVSPYHPAQQQHISQVQPPGDNEPD